MFLFVTNNQQIFKRYFQYSVVLCNVYKINEGISLRIDEESCHVEKEKCYYEKMSWHIEEETCHVEDNACHKKEVESRHEKEKSRHALSIELEKYYKNVGTGISTHFC